MNGIFHPSEPWVQAFVIAFGLWAGVLGAYGRELNENRKPTVKWWVSRLAILPLLGIITSAAVDQLKLNRQQSAVLAGMLAVSGYEALRLILSRFEKRLGKADASAEEEIAPGPAAPRPYVSKIDTDEADRPTAHILPVDHEHPVRGAVGEAVRGVYQRVVKEELPDDLAQLLGEADRRTHGDRNPGEDPPLQP